MDPTPHRAGSVPSEGSLESVAVEPLMTRDYESNPDSFYERLRQRYGPVAPVDVLGVPVWLVIGYPQVLDVLRDDQGVWSKQLTSWRARNEGRVPSDWPLLPAFEVDNVVFRDGQRLHQLRSAWHTALAPFQDRTHPQARNLESAVTRYSDELISVMSEGGGRTGWADLSAQFTRPLPLMVANRLLGFEGGHGDEALMDMWRLLDAGADAAAAQQRLLGSIGNLVSTKMQRPGDDFPSYMLAADPSLTVDDLAREVIMIIGLIGDYTGTLICNTAAEVISGNAGARASLSDRIIKETVNRVAMARPPMANLTARFPLVDLRIGNFTLAAGDPVMLSVEAAHRDPVFAGNMSEESVLSSRAHLAWGAGPHHCLGRELATTVTTIAVSRLFERFSALELTLPPDQLPWRSSPMMRGLRSLPVKYELSASGMSQGVSHQATDPAADATAAPESTETPLAGLWRFLRGLRRER